MNYFIPLFLLAILSSCGDEPTKTAAPAKKAKTIILHKKENETRSDIGERKLFVLPNEEVVFEFKTKKGKRVTVCKAKNEDYLVYRFGAENKVELQFPEKLDQTSFDKFESYHYFRPGGIENLGMSLDNISFVNGGFRYVVYNNYASESVGHEEEVGIEIIELKTKKVTRIEGDINSFSGGFPEDILGKLKEGRENYN